jgi:hypothetical protein
MADNSNPPPDNALYYDVTFALIDAAKRGLDKERRRKVVEMALYMEDYRPTETPSTSTPRKA